jgi:hypothetical protein
MRVEEGHLRARSAEGASASDLAVRLRKRHGGGPFRTLRERRSMPRRRRSAAPKLPTLKRKAGQAFTTNRDGDRRRVRCG